MLKFKYGECAMLDRSSFNIDPDKEQFIYDIKGWHFPDDPSEYTWLKCCTIVIVFEDYWNEDFGGLLYKILYGGSIYYVLENCLLKIGDQNEQGDFI